MRCKWCGSKEHFSDNCPTRKLVEYLTTEECVGSPNLPYVVVATEKNLVDIVEEAHALLHIKRKEKEQ